MQELNRTRLTEVGNSNYDAKTMLKILVYGYSYGWRSSRKLERALYHNVSFIWLAGGLKPSYRTISRFRTDNQKALIAVLKQCVRLCIKLKLIEGNCLFLDGSKIRGNASINKTLSKKKAQKILYKVDKRIEEIIIESQNIDNQEKGGFAKLQEELKDQKKLRNKVKAAIEEMDDKKQDSINTTDKDCINFKSRQGYHAGYNAQTVTDEKDGLIVNTDVVSKANDYNQFSKQIQKANDNLGKKCKTACSDAGYFKTKDLKKSVEEGIDVIVPSQKQILQDKSKDDPFGKDKFKYDKENDQYICPEGKILKFSYCSKDRDHYVYRIRNSSLCRKCINWGICTKAKEGRNINRLGDEQSKEYIESRYKSEYGQNIYKKRKEKVELQFGHIKRTLNGSAFLLRGLNAVRGEMAIFANCFNIARMITLLGGVRSMIGTLEEISI